MEKNIKIYWRLLTLFTVVYVSSGFSSVYAQTSAKQSEQQVKLAKESRKSYTTTTSYSTISGDELVKSGHYSLGAALAGRLSGLIVSQNSNEPGAENFSLSVRGTSTPNGKNPLILIDGLVCPTFEHINPRDVESVTVLKDASAVALYGMQGGNGVILIETKRGYFSEPSITATAQYTVQQISRTPDMINSGDYATLTNEMYQNGGNGAYYKYKQNEIDKYYSGEDPYMYPNNDWYDIFMKPLVQSQHINVSAVGGGRFMRYYTSVGYMHQDSPFKYDKSLTRTLGIDRYHIRSNVDVDINKYLKGFMNIAGRVQRHVMPNSGNGSVMSSIFDASPNIYGPLNPDGQVTTTTQIKDPTYGQLNRSGYRKQISTHINALIGVSADLSFITKGLSTKAQASFYTNALSNIHAAADYERWVPDEARPGEFAFVKYGTNIYKPAELAKGVSYEYLTEMEWSVEYDRDFGKHHVGGQGFISEEYRNSADLNLGILPYVKMTYGAHLNYGFSNFASVDLVASYQGSEQFAKDNRYGFFPAASAAWVISNHNFMKNVKTISFLKVRASYGLVGNDDISNERYLYKDNLIKNTTGFIADWSGSIDENRIGNPFLTYEKSAIANVGVDIGLWENLTLSVDYFNDRRTDILINRNTVPATGGIAANVYPPTNMGEVLNQGVDLQASYSRNFGKDISLTVYGNYSYNHNEVKKMDEVKYSDDYAYVYRSTGFRLGQQWGYLIDYSNGNGYFNSREEIAMSGLTYEGQAPRPGDFKYRDLNGDKMIDSKDQAPLGNSGMPKVTWGAGVNFRWKGIDVSLLFQGLAGMSMTYNGCGFYETYSNGTFSNRHKNAWTQERYESGAKITAPALSASATSSQANNDYYSFDKSFVRLKNAEIGYTLPESVTNKMKMKGMRIYVSGLNLLVFDKLDTKDIDPEMSSMTVFPQYRYFNVGINLTF